MIGIGLNIGNRVIVSGGGYDPDAQAFFDRVTTAGGTLTTTEKIAVNQLVLDMKSAGIWTSMKAVYPMVGASAAACAQNLKSASFTGTFTSGWTFASTGVTPNGTSAYMDTGLNQSVYLSQTNGEIGTYLRTNTSGTFCDIGSYFAGTNYALFSYLGATNTFYARIATADLDSNYNPLNSLGLFSIKTNGVNAQKFVKNGVVVANKTQGTNTLESINVSIGAARTITGAQFFSPRQTAFSYISDTLTDTQASNFYTAVQTFNQTLNRQVGAQIVSDADAQAYINRVYTAGGTLTNTEANAVNQLVIDMKAAGIWTAMKAVYPMVGASAAACAQNLKSSSFTGTFTSGWTFASTGATPNGTSAYMNTGLVPNTSLTNNNLHLSFYSRTQNSQSSAELGSSNSGYVNQYTLDLYYVGVAQKVFVASSYPLYSATSTNTDTLGFGIGSRTSTTSAKVYMDGVLLGTNTNNNPNGLSNFSIYISAQNNAGTAQELSSKECAFSSIGDGLDDTQAASLYSCVNSFQVSLSRNV